MNKFVGKQLYQNTKISNLNPLVADLLKINEVQKKVRSSLVETGISGENCLEVVKVLSDILSFEAATIDDLKKKYDNPLDEYMNSQISFDLFQTHENLITQTYGDASNFFELGLHDNYVEILNNNLKTMESVKVADFTLENNSNKLLHAVHFQREKALKMDEDITWIDFNHNKLSQELHEGIRILIKTEMKSPFAIVNTRAWTTRPTGAAYGPNEDHKDGLHPGHLKVMVYLTPMDVDHGYFVVTGQDVIHRPRGNCILFKNSDFLHRGVPGEKYPRICMELTLHRTLLNVDQIQNGHPFGRHYKTIGTAYSLATESAVSLPG